MSGKEAVDSTPVASARDTLVPWVEKYRPASLSDITAHEHIIGTVQRLVEEDRLPHLLFYGPPGTGKTTTILAIARQMYGASMSSMTLELNASDDRGIEVVRKQIKEFASTKQIFREGGGGTKLVILDEADSMTNDAQMALRRVIEKYTSSTRFCMICNYVGKISPALQSRCTRFRFSPLGEEQIEPRLKFVASAEKLNYTEDGMAACIKLANGDMRKCLNVLQASAMSFEIINEDAIYTCTGNPLPSDMEEALGWLLNEDFKTARKNLLELKLSKGLALTDLLREIYNYGSLIEFPDQAKMFFFNRLAQIEYNVSLGTDENLQLSAVVGIFQHIKEMCED